MAGDGDINWSPGESLYGQKYKLEQKFTQSLLSLKNFCAFFLFFLFAEELLFDSGLLIDYPSRERMMMHYTMNVVPKDVSCNRILLLLLLVVFWSNPKEQLLSLYPSFYFPSGNQSKNHQFSYCRHDYADIRLLLHLILSKLDRPASLLGANLDFHPDQWMDGSIDRWMPFIKLP